MPSLGSEFARALAAKDFGRARGLLADDVDFRALTPRRDWEPADADAVVSDVLSVWFGEPAHVDELIELSENPPVVDRHHVSWRLRGRDEDGPFIVEQQAYYVPEEGRIAWMRLLCSGMRTEGRS